MALKNLTPTSLISDIRPQEGPQMAFAECKADIAIYGGAAYSGKTFAILYDPLRTVWKSPRFNGVIFRREMPQITAGGGLWDTSRQIYPKTFGIPTESKHLWRWPRGGTIKMTHLQLEQDIYSHHSAQYVYIAFDELEFFTEQQFWYLHTRNRPPMGYRGRCWMRAGTNPNADSWIRDLLDWWIGPDGYPIQERSGVLRYFTRDNDRLIWVDPDWRDPMGNPPKSFTYIPGSIDDNVIGNKVDPTYKSNLYAQDTVTRERLLKGNWNISFTGGMFNPDWIQIIEPNEVPACKRIRYWDLAATAQDEKKQREPDWTAGGLVGEKDGNIFIIDVVRYQESPAVVEQKIKRTAELDGVGVTIGYEEEHGSSGKYVSLHWQQVLSGYDFIADYVTGEKVERAKPWAALAEQGRVFLVRGDWNRAFLAELGSFPLHKRDQVDCVSGAVKLLRTSKRVWPFFNRAKSTYCRAFTLKWDNYFHFGAVVIGKDLQVYVLAACYQKNENVLYIYGELMAAQIAVTNLASRIVTGMNWQSRAVHGLFGTPDMFASEGKSLALTLNAELRRAAIDCKNRNSIQPAEQYDRLGMIGAVAQMFVDRRIVVHESCQESLRQFGSWHIENDKPAERSAELCEALCLIVSAVNRYTPPKPVEKKPFHDPHYKPVLDKRKQQHKNENSYQWT
jgi:predicted phage terminase large subunit-like protein